MGMYIIYINIDIDSLPVCFFMIMFYKNYVFLDYYIVQYYCLLYTSVSVEIFHFEIDFKYNLNLRTWKSCMVLHTDILIHDCGKSYLWLAGWLYKNI